MLDILKYISVIKFNASQYRHERIIMQKLGAFIEKSRIIFIAFDDNVFPFSKMIITVKIFYDSSDHKNRIEASVIKNPG